MSKSQSIIPGSLPSPILTFLKWQEVTAGRDKVLRLVAYFSKYAIHFMASNDISPDWQKRLKSGASNIGVTRKVLRFFRAVEYLNEILKSLRVKDDVERYLSLWKSFWLCVWMCMDHLQWLNKVGYLKLTDLKKIDEYHSKGWLFGLVAGFIIAAYKMKQAMEETKTARLALQKAGSDPTQLVAANQQLKEAEKKRSKQMTALVKNGVDALIPATRLEWLPLNDGMVGIAGTITSVIGINESLKPFLK